MIRSASIVLYLMAIFTVAATPASAQFVPRTLNDPATGESYHVEGSAGYWSPGADLVISSTGLGIPGTAIDMKKDLGLTNRRFNELHLILRPGTKHKFRLDYIPMKYDGSGSIPREIVFNGQKYNVGVPVTWLVDWKAYRFSYEYDFITTGRGFGGLIIETKYTKLETSLRTPFQTTPENFLVKGPLPSLGGIGRGYVTPNISITGEVTGISIPKTVGETLGGSGSYIEYNFYGTVNITNNVGGQIGYRAINVDVSIPGRSGGDGSLLMKGLYFGIIARY